MEDIDILEETALNVKVAPEHIRIKNIIVSIFGFQDNLKYLIYFPNHQYVELHTPQDVVTTINSHVTGELLCQD